MSERLRVYRADVRNSMLFYCADMRHWFAKYDMSFADFLEHGIDADELLEKSNNDSMAVKAVEVAKLRREQGVQ